jgi:hypothetical protein
VGVGQAGGPEPPSRGQKGRKGEQMGYWGYEEEDAGDDRDEFADPGGRSALRAETRDDPRDQPCPTCDRPNRLTRADMRHGYQCDSCADKAERGCD